MIVKLPKKILNLTSLKTKIINLDEKEFINEIKSKLFEYMTFAPEKRGQIKLNYYADG